MTHDDQPTYAELMRELWHELGRNIWSRLLLGRSRLRLSWSRLRLSWTYAKLTLRTLLGIKY